MIEAIEGYNRPDNEKSRNRNNQVTIAYIKKQGKALTVL